RSPTGAARRPARRRRRRVARRRRNGRRRATDAPPRRRDSSRRECPRCTGPGPLRPAGTAPRRRPCPYRKFGPMVQTVLPRRPVEIDDVLDDPGLVRRMAVDNAPYWPVQRYFANAAEQEALSAGSTGGELVVAPVFRGDWAYDRPLVDGVDAVLHNERLIEAARRLYEGAIVRPQIVYANLTAPMPMFDPGHTDIPAFRGVDRTQYPVWLLVQMGRSGLFE